ncbi:uncharacterized protein LOC131007835 [Salvia miltiorrhiza]|uniref:uncharacterized protein LOC131007835 n=1 Tax=Salvia miltiorrhiza TaxID=226208 RepID=UPI0025ABA64C|nr:uncharacterized protein LOC131007835 [Salvia miltiorrhiza]
MVATTRSTEDRLGQLEKVVGELQTSLVTLTATVDSNRSTIESQLAAILAAVSHHDKPPVLPHHTPDPTGTPPISLPLQRMDLPVFDGLEPRGWIARANQYFLVHQIADNQKLQIAIIAMSGAALSWLHLFLRRTPNPAWPDFTRALLERFGDASTFNTYEALFLFRQTGSLEEHIAAFEGRAAQLPIPLSDDQMLGYFLGGLKSSVRDRIQDTALTNYDSAVRAARRAERPSTVPGSFSRAVTLPVQTSRPVYPPRTTVTPPPPGSATSPQSSNFSKAHKFRQLPQSEIQKHLAAGTCFRCSLPFGPLHRCPPKTLNVLVYDDLDDSESATTPAPDLPLSPNAEADDTPEETTLQHSQLSELTFFGFDGPQTMKFFGCVNQTRLLIMVDSGASHCFISEKMATALQLQVDSIVHSSVTLGDGTRVRSRGFCKDVPLLLDGVIFSISCYVFPLSSVDLILGISWLATLGNVKTNWATLTMEFSASDRDICLRGDRSLTRRRCDPRKPHELTSADTCWILWLLDGEQIRGVSPNLSADAQRALANLLAEFPEVSTPATTLPPPRAHDHRIPLQPGSHPV